MTPRTCVPDATQNRRKAAKASVWPLRALARSTAFHEAWLVFVFALVLLCVSTGETAENASGHEFRAGLPAAASPSASSKIHNAIPTRTIDELSVSMGQESFVNRGAPPAGVADYTQMRGRLRTRSERKVFNGVLEVGGSISTSVEKYSNIEVPEAYLDWANERPEEATLGRRVSVGRRREAWSPLDSQWGLGIWQPLNRFDGLRTSEQGLTGVFASLKRGEGEVLLFGSSVYIPEQGAPFELKNGRFFTRSPWFTPPSDSLIFREEAARVNYELETPTVGSVIHHGSVGLLARIGAADEGPFAQVAGMRKPRNTLSPPFEGKLFLTDTESYANVGVYPKVLYHTLMSADAGYRTPSFFAGLSALREVPDEEATDDGLNHQVLEDLTLVSPRVGARLLPSRFWGPVVEVAYLTSSGGGSRLVGPLAADPSAFGPRTMYKEAVSVSLRSQIYDSASVRIDSGVKWIEELAEQGTIVMGDLQMRFAESWRLAFWADALGSRQPVSRTDTFISRYRGNDRVAAQVTFDF